MLESLSEKLTNALKRFRSKGKLTEADVNFKVVKEFVKSVTERAVGETVMESLLPAQQIVKIVNEELIKLMGGDSPKLEISSRPPTVVMMVGLQGAGKTTHAAKIASMYKKKGKNPLLVACDVYRPAAIDQLKIVGESVGVPVFSMGDKVSPVKIAKEGVAHARKNMHDMVFIDTAGRLQIDEVLMEELEKIKKEVEPKEILLTVDAMTGQEAVNVAKAFDDLLDVTGVVLTKMDGDARGGAALSVRYVTGKPIKFIGTGEKLDMIETFHPDRMASRILGMGDVLSLIEKAEQAIDEKKAAEMERKMREASFTLDDFLEQLHALRKMGNIDQILSMIPGVKPGALKDVNMDEKQMDRVEAIVLSMTPRERANPDLINGSRRKRIAQGSGTTVEDVNKLLRQFDQMKKMMKQMSGTGGKRRGMFGRGMKMPF